MTKWEHKIITTAGSDADLTSEFDSLGQEGWELVGMETIPGNFMRAMFKRPIVHDKPFRVGVT